MNLLSYFDRVVLINLKRRPDRLAQAKVALQQCRWPFKPPEIFAAIDGRESRPSRKWQSGPGAWGASLSHQHVLGQAIANGAHSVLVMEDDVCFAENFRARIQEFLEAVPEDWDQLMIGGQHINTHGDAAPVNAQVVKCTDCERMHCYAIRGKFMRRFRRRMRGGGIFNGQVHCDWILGRDPEMQLAHKVYAPVFFLAGQARSLSDVNCLPFSRMVPRKFWNPPSPALSVVNLHAPDAVAESLVQHGFSRGRHCGRNGDLDVKFKEIFDATRGSSRARLAQLREWLKLMQWELAADPGFICTVHHTQATASLVKAASLWRVHEITAAAVSDALMQLPPRLRRELVSPTTFKLATHGVVRGCIQNTPHL